MDVDAQHGPLETEVRQDLADFQILETEVRRSGDALVDHPTDRACLELAITYARAIDQGDDLAKVGPALLACLTALGMTPAARAALAKGGTSAGPSTSPLDELRARRAARAG